MSVQWSKACCTFQHFGSSARLVAWGRIKCARIWVNEIRQNGGYRRSRDKKRVIPSMNPRARRKPVVVRVSLGARSPHYSWFIQTRAARFYYFLVTSQGRTRVRCSSFPYRDITVTTTVSTLSTRPRLPLFLPFCFFPSIFSFRVSPFFRLVHCRVGVRDASEKLHVQATMTLLSGFLPPLTVRRRSASAESVIFPTTFRQRLHDTDQLSPCRRSPRQNFRTLTRMAFRYGVFVTKVTLTVLSLPLRVIE